MSPQRFQSAGVLRSGYSPEPFRHFSRPNDRIDPSDSCHRQIGKKVGGSHGFKLPGSNLLVRTLTETGPTGMVRSPHVLKRQS